MFTEYTREEIAKRVSLQSEGSNSENIAEADTPEDEANYEVEEINYVPLEYNNGEQNTYDMDSESLW